jgi:predicted amidohydrolase
VRIGACQTPEILGDLDAAIGTILDFAGQADEVGLDLLLFPECFLQGYLVTDQHVHGQAIELASPRFTAALTCLSGVRQMLVLGMIERWGGSYYNTAVVITGGRVVGSYRKTFLTSGESVFTAGDTFPVFTRRGLPFGINICYDTQFPQAAAAVAARGAQLLLVPAQNMMRRDNAYWWQERHNQIRKRRVRETRDVAGVRRRHRATRRIPNRPGAYLSHSPGGPRRRPGTHRHRRHRHRRDQPAVDQHRPQARPSCG